MASSVNDRRARESSPEGISSDLTVSAIARLILERPSPMSFESWPATIVQTGGGKGERGLVKAVYPPNDFAKALLRRLGGARKTGPDPGFSL